MIELFAELDHKFSILGLNLLWIVPEGNELVTVVCLATLGASPFEIFGALSKSR